jgi:hypothetical protein
MALFTSEIGNNSPKKTLVGIFKGGRLVFSCENESLERRRTFVLLELGTRNMVI